MAVRLIGRTTARYGNQYREQTLAGATLVFYGQGNEPRDDGPRATPSRWGFRRLHGDQLPPDELGRAAVEADGTWSTSLETYQGGGLVVAIEVSRFTYAPDTGRRVAGILGVAFGPDEPRVADGGGAENIGSIDIDLSPDPYCNILAALDLWLVAGRVTDCGPKVQTPLIGGSVTAFDRDLIQDDTLGTAPTDATGSFEIYFPGSAFRVLPSLPPPFDVISPFELVGGPDIYFKVTLGAVALLDEPKATGRTPGRENRHNCSYTELCVATPGWTPQTVTLWSRIGNVLVPDGGGLHDFDADGFVDSGKLAFTGHIDFNGQVSQQYLGSPVSFRFLFAEWPTLTTAPAYPAAYAPLTTQITGAPYGDIYQFIGPDPWDYTLTPVPPSPDPATGWVAVNQSPNFVRDVGRMVQVDTTTLVPAVAHPGSEQAGAGAPVPVPERDPARKFSFVLEVKTVANPIPMHGVPVTIHVNNSVADLRYDLTELLSTACNPLTANGGTLTVHPLYTVGHPYLQSYAITIQRQGGVTTTVRSDDYTAHGSLWTDADGESSGPGGFPAAYSDVQPCSYRTWITCYRRLTDGISNVGHQTVLRTFCID